MSLHVDLFFISVPVDNQSADLCGSFSLKFYRTVHEKQKVMQRCVHTDRQQGKKTKGVIERMSFIEREFRCFLVEIPCGPTQGALGLGVVILASLSF